MSVNSDLESMFSFCDTEHRKTTMTMQDQNIVSFHPNFFLLWIFGIFQRVEEGLLDAAGPKLNADVGETEKKNNHKTQNVHVFDQTINNFTTNENKNGREERRAALGLVIYGREKYDDFDQIGTLYTGWVGRFLIYGHIQHHYLDSCNI